MPPHVCSNVARITAILVAACAALPLCTDDDAGCADYLALGDTCSGTRFEYMSEYCRATCGLCSSTNPKIAPQQPHLANLDLPTLRQPVAAAQTTAGSLQLISSSGPQHVMHVGTFLTQGYDANLTMLSLASHLPSATQLHIHIVTVPEMYPLHQQWLGGVGRLHFYDITHHCGDLDPQSANYDPLFAGMQSRKAYDVTCKCRLRASRIFSVERILIVDTDVIAVNDPTPCFNYKLVFPQMLGLAPDLGEAYSTRYKEFKDDLWPIGVSPRNSGNQLHQLEWERKLNFSEDIFSFALSTAKSLGRAPTYGSQDIMNAYFVNHSYVVADWPCGCNQQPIHWMTGNPYDYKLTTPTTFHHHLLDSSCKMSDSVLIHGYNDLFGRNPRLVLALLDEHPHPLSDELKKQVRAKMAFNVPQTTVSYDTEGLGPIQFQSRDDLGSIINREGFTVGAELGVKQGLFAEHTLSHWKLAQTYVLVDAWRQLENYDDVANVADNEHEAFYNETMSRMKLFSDSGVNVTVCRGFTTECVDWYPDRFFDYIYVDARHDYKGVLVDLVEWYPKLKPGGIFAGHDYVTQDEGPQQTGQDWTVNYDGTIDHTRTVVKGAVNEFAKRHDLVVSSSQEPWPSWAIRKPH